MIVSIPSVMKKYILEEETVVQVPNSPSNLKVFQLYYSGGNTRIVQFSGRICELDFDNVRAKKEGIVRQIITGRQNITLDDVDILGRGRGSATIHTLADIQTTENQSNDPRMSGFYNHRLTYNSVTYGTKFMQPISLVLPAGTRLMFSTIIGSRGAMFFPNMEELLTLRANTIRLYNLPEELQMLGAVTITTPYDALNGVKLKD